MTVCNFFWGSHGCDLEPGDHRIHQCGTYWDEHYNDEYEDMVDADICCQYDEGADEDQRVRWADDNPETWSEWGPYGEGWRQEPHKFATGGLVKNPPDFSIPVYDRGCIYPLPSYSTLKTADWIAKIKAWKTYFETEYKASLKIPWDAPVTDEEVPPFVQRAEAVIEKMNLDILIKPTQENGEK